MHFLVALKVYKELERLLKLSDIEMSVEKVFEKGKDRDHHQRPHAAKQDSPHQNDAHEEAQTHCNTIRRGFLGSVITKSGNRGVPD